MIFINMIKYTNYYYTFYMDIVVFCDITYIRILSNLEVEKLKTIEKS